MQVAVGNIVEGKVAKITNYGAFVDLEGGGTGMIHISEVANTYVKDINDHLQVGQTVKVKVIGINPENKVSLSAVTGLLFLVSVLLAPVAGIIPGAATAPALIIVGVYMLAGAAKIQWNDFEVALPAFLTIAMMPFAYSIADGIGFGFISYTVIKVARGKAKEVPALMYVLSALFVVMYILLFR